MSLKSMTGFGQGFAEGGGLRVDVEISSVNRKQLDILVNMPRSLQTLEPWVVEQISRGVSRGRINVQVGVTFSGRDVSRPVTIDRELARSCLKELRATARELGIEADITMRDLLRLPGIVRVQEADQDIEQVTPVIRRALTKALASFMSMRTREGRALLKDLGSRIDGLESVVVRIAARAPQLVDGYRKTLRARITQLAGNLAIEDERIEKEVVLYADRADITEELTRLRSHIKQARGMFRSKDPAGRSLDFLAQEMFREINTIGSKAGDAEISALVVGFKADLERFREQVQNIE